MLEVGGTSFATVHDGPVFSLLRYDDCEAAFRDPETFSSRIWEEIQGPFLGRTLLAMDGEEHRIWRGLLTPAFSTRSLAGWDVNTLQPIAKEMVEEIAGQKRADLNQFALRFPIRVIYGIIGFDEHVDAYDDFATLAASMLLVMGGMDPDPAKAELMQRNFGRAVAAGQELLTRIEGVVARKRAAGEDDNTLITLLINAEFEGRQLDDEEIAVFVRSLLPPGTETTSRMVINTLTTLLNRPALLDEVREDRSLVMPAILEAERYEPVVLINPRVTTRDVEVRGVTIPMGAAVMLCTGSANRDPDTFPDPDDFDINRKGRPAFTFGFGSHICVGMNTSRREIVAMINAILDGLPRLRLDPDAAPPTIRGVNLRSTAALNVVWD